MIVNKVKELPVGQGFDATDLISKKGKSGAMNLFIKSAPLHLRVQMNDSTEWQYISYICNELINY